MSKEKCPTCGTMCQIEWHGLDLVAASGDETLASKTYTPLPESKEPQGEENWKAKVEFYRSETDKLRDYIFKNNIGLPCQSIFQAAIDEMDGIRQSTQQGQDEWAYKAFVDELQARTDRILRDTGSSSKEVFDAINNVTEELKQYFIITRKPQ